MLLSMNFILDLTGNYNRNIEKKELQIFSNTGFPKCIFTNLKNN